MLKIGMIGAGAISEYHIKQFISNPDTEICAICDVNEANAKMRAEKFSIPAYYTDYKKILEDDKIDAVSIVTPTFTHKPIIVDALKAGKHVLCEKPPALNYQEALECEKAAKESGKILMFAFVARFSKESKFLKEYVDAGKMGQIYFAEVSRMSRCSRIDGWFVSKEKAGGGTLIDGAIHEIDAAMYLMGFPKIKSIKGYTTNINDELLDKAKSIGVGWDSLDTNKYERTVETLSSGMVTFENGACMNIKASRVLNTTQEGRNIELSGTKAGFKHNGASQLSIVEFDQETGYYMETAPILKDSIDAFSAEIKHFVDCCQGKAELICPPEQATEIMKIVSGIYESAETGKEIIF